MRDSEVIAAVYFAYLLAPIALVEPRPKSRLALAACAIAVIAAVLFISTLPRTKDWQIVRDWAPGAYLLAGYWLPGRLQLAPNQRLERSLLRIDSRLFEIFSAVRIPQLVLECLEASYLFCYPLVPAGFAVIYFSGVENGLVAADRFWRVVLLAVWICYGLLPWVPTRPPRMLEGSDRHVRGVRRLNMFVLRHASIQINTLPSGHAAAAVAVALALCRVLPLAGVIAGVLALSICAASVIGRYHYAVDVVLGVAVGVVAFAVLG